MSYATNEYYIENYSKALPTKEIDKYLKKASREIDNLTFNRINQVGVSNLTDFQLEIIQKVNCELAEFNYENEDLLNSILSSYAINGVNMSFENSKNITIKNGVVIPIELYDYLSQTGLTCLNIRW